MLTLGPIGFLSPAELALLLALPIIWWLLRSTPPRPKSISFPPFRLLLGLERTDETPDRSPWWLTAIRILAAALVIFSFARPVLNPEPAAGSGEGPLLLIVDNGWAAATDWSQRSALISSLLDQAEDAGQPIALVPTATPLKGAVRFQSATDLRPTALTLGPHSFAPDRKTLMNSLAASLENAEGLNIVWLSDGLDYGAGEDFASLLAQSGTLTLYEGAPQPWLYPPTLVEGALAIKVQSATKGETTGELVAFAQNGRTIGRETFALGSGETQTEVQLSLPIELRNQIARIEIAASRNAGGVALLDDRWRRRVVGLISGTSVEITQPLLAPLYYVERALAPYAEFRRNAPGEESRISSLLVDRLSMLVLADVGKLLDEDARAVQKWVDEGGTLVRFAGPRLAAGDSNLLPVALRRGGRSLEGALSWGTPQQLSPFDASSPFAGLAIPAEVTVNRQVLAEPGLELNERTWARLADGTPLVTATRQGNGRVILFHVTANSDWSNLPLSGLFVDMLQRLVDISEGVGSSNSGVATEAAHLRPHRTLDAAGSLTAPPITAMPILASSLPTTRSSAAHPPGFYGSEDALRALNTTDPEAAPVGLSVPANADIRAYSQTSETSLGPLLILAAFALLLIDLAATLALSGLLSNRFGAGVKGTSMGAVILLAMSLASDPGHAQDQSQNQSQSQSQEQMARDARAMMASLQTRLGYVLTGDGEVDNISEAGLHTLSFEISNRTSLEPAAPVGLNIETDDLVFYPLIYWPVLEGAEAPTQIALAKLDTYLKTGGTILFDTRDPLAALPTATIKVSRAGEALRRVLAGLNIPPLEPVPPNHVLTKAFYLLQNFPGRFDGGEMWVETAALPTGSEAPQTTSRTNTDGVSSVVISANDLAGAWAHDARGAPMLPIATGGPSQREMAIRTGINLVMYTLTGNYKADQVHVPSLLERLGQ